MGNNLFYKALAALSTVGIIAAAGSVVQIALKKGNTAEDQLAKTMMELKNARKDALAEVKSQRKELLNEIKTIRGEALSEVKTARVDALKAIEQAAGVGNESIWLLLRFGAVERGGGFIQKIPMQDISQCEIQGALFLGSKRLWPDGDARGFECLEGGN